MARGAPPTSSRGRGGGKFKKFTRGGGKHFSRDLRPLDADGNEVSMWAENAQKRDSGSDSDSEEDSDDDDSEESSDDDEAKPQQQSEEMTREQRRLEKKKKKEVAAARARGQNVQVGDLPPSDDDESSDNDADLPANPNHSKAARKQTQIVRKPDGEDDDDKAVGEAAEGVGKMKVGLSRREREAKEAAEAKERYQRLHEQGKTDQAKADLERLRLVRERREAEAARKQAEKEEREEQEKEKRAEIDAREARKREAALGKPKKSKK